MKSPNQLLPFFAGMAAGALLIGMTSRLPSAQATSFLLMFSFGYSTAHMVLKHESENREQEHLRNQLAHAEERAAFWETRKEETETYYKQLIQTEEPK